MKRYLSVLMISCLLLSMFPSGEIKAEMTDGQETAELQEMKTEDLESEDAEYQNVGYEELASEDLEPNDAASENADSVNDESQDDSQNIGSGDEDLDNSDNGQKDPAEADVSTSESAVTEKSDTGLGASTGIEEKTILNGNAAEETEIPGPDTEWYSTEIDNDEMFADYADSLFYTTGELETESVGEAARGNSLTGQTLVMYNAIKEAVTAIAAGERESSVIEVPISSLLENHTVGKVYTGEDLGVDGFVYDC